MIWFANLENLAVEDQLENDLKEVISTSNNPGARSDAQEQNNPS